MGTRRDLLMEVAEPVPRGRRAEIKHFGGWQRGGAGTHRGLPGMECQLPEPTTVALLALSADLSWANAASHSPSCPGDPAQDSIAFGIPWACRLLSEPGCSPSPRDPKVRRCRVACKEIIINHHLWAAACRKVRLAQCTVLPRAREGAAATGSPCLQPRAQPASGSSAMAGMSLSHNGPAPPACA